MTHMLQNSPLHLSVLPLSPPKNGFIPEHSVDKEYLHSGGILIRAAYEAL